MIPFRRVGKIILRCLLAGIVLLGLLAVAAYCFPQKFLTVDSGPVKADVIVVLGGGLHERPARAAKLFKEDAAPRIIVSGLGDDESHRRLMIEAGVPSSVMQLESKSRTTRENAEFTVKLLREQKAARVIIVTSWYHSRRALACFEHEAPDIKFYSRPSYFASERVEWKKQGLNRRIYMEFIKLPGYWMHYGVWPFWLK